MSNTLKSIVSTAGALTVAAAILTSTPALAGPGNLRCNSPFGKIATYSNSIKCKKGNTYDTRAQAVARKNYLLSRAGCNSNHWSPPKSWVWAKGNRWGVRVTFICAIIY